MPELPEVETMRRRSVAVIGSTIAAVSTPPCDRRPIQMTPTVDQIDGALKGKQIVAVDRRGKRVLLRSSDGQL